MTEIQKISEKARERIVADDQGRENNLESLNTNPIDYISGCLQSLSMAGRGGQASVDALYDLVTNGTEISETPRLEELHHAGLVDALGQPSSPLVRELVKLALNQNGSIKATYEQEAKKLQDARPELFVTFF